MSQLTIHDRPKIRIPIRGKLAAAMEIRDDGWVRCKVIDLDGVDWGGDGDSDGGRSCWFHVDQLSSVTGMPAPQIENVSVWQNKR